LEKNAIFNKLRNNFSMIGYFGLGNALASKNEAKKAI